MNVLRLSIPPLPRFAAPARRAFLKFARFHRLTALDAENLLLAMGEAIANAIRHAATDEAIEVQIRIDGGVVVATIRDRGCGFALPAQRQLALPSVSAEAGRGITIMQRCTHFLDIRRGPETGTVVTLGRYRSRHQELAAVS
ncbi:MAG TPA: ATP-binding protein [Candidatus Cybelea sp.]